MSIRKNLALAVVAVFFSPAVAFAGTAITGLSELAETAAADDQAVVVDVSDTSMAASGTTKRVSVSNLVGGVAEAAYLRLDAANDPVTAETHFGAGIRGDAAGCSDPTELTIDGSPGSYDGNDYAVDLLSGECPGQAIAAVNEEFTQFTTICSGATGDISVVFDALGTDAVRLCMIDFSDIIGEPGLFASFLMPSSDTCTGLLDTVFEGPGHGVTAAIDDPAFLKWNDATCTYDDRDRADTYTIVAGWSDPVDVSTGSEMIYEWQIADDGDATLGNIVADGVRIGDELPGSGSFDANLSVVTNYALDDTANMAAYGAAIIREFTTTESCVADCGSAGGLYVSVSAQPSHDFAGAFQAANYESLLWSDNTIGAVEVIRFLNYAWGDFTLTDGYTSVNIPGPSVSRANSDPTTPYYYGINITDWTICGTCTVTVPDNVGINIGTLTAGANNYGIKTAADVLLTDDVKMLFGTDEDAALVYDEITDDELKVLFGAAERINMDSTGIAFNGATPFARPDYTTSNCIADREFDANATTTEELADVLCTLIADLEAYGLVQ